MTVLTVGLDTDGDAGELPSAGADLIALDEEGRRFSVRFDDQDTSAHFRCGHGVMSTTFRRGLAKGRKSAFEAFLEHRYLSDGCVEAASRHGQWWKSGDPVRSLRAGGAQLSLNPPIGLW